MFSTVKPTEQSGVAATGSGYQRDLFNSLTGIAARLQRASRVCLLANFDGVLAPTVPDPSDAAMPPAVRSALTRLGQNARVCVGIIGHRTVSNLLLNVGLAGIMYAGNNGLAISGPGFQFVEPVAHSRKELLNTLTDELATQLRPIPGVTVENRGVTATVHYGRANRDDALRVQQIASRVVGKNGTLFETAQDHDLVEVRPRVSWSKGLAAQWMIARTGAPDALPVYLADDSAEADTFQALGAGITVKVGGPEDPRAHYYLPEQRQVAEFLDWLASETE